jgi:Tol biopolymer transport system component
VRGSPTRRCVDGDPEQIVTVVSVERPEDKHVLPLRGRAEDPAWSPDGTQLVIRLNRDLAVVRVAGGPSRALLSPPNTGVVMPADVGEAVRPGWSPGGIRIIYTLATMGEQCSIWVMNPDGSGRTRLTDGRQCDTDAAWQPIPRS